MSLEARLIKLEKDRQMVDELVEKILLAKDRGDALRNELKKLREENEILKQQEQNLIANRSVDPNSGDQMVAKIGELPESDFDT